MKLILILFLVLFSFDARAEEKLELRIKNDGDNFIVYLVNVWGADVVVNGRFASGGVGDPAEVRLVFLDERKKKYHLDGFVRVLVPTEQDYVVLKPHRVIGSYFYVKSLKDFYNLNPGNYKVKAIFEDKVLAKKGAFSKRLESEYITIEVK